MYPFYAWDECYVVHVKQTKLQKFIYKCIIFFVFKKNCRFVVVSRKKKWIWFIKNHICFWELLKNGLLMKEKSNLFYKTKSFDLKKIYISNLFLYVQEILKRFFFFFRIFFFRSKFHLWNKFMLHVLNKTNTTNTIMYDLFLYFKIRICQKKKKIRFVYDKDTN